MSNETEPETFRGQVYQAYKRFQKDHIGTVVVCLDSSEERLRLSPHRYAEEHELVVEAALWVSSSRLDGSFKYKTYIRKELENGSPGHGSIVNDGTYARTYREAVEWLENEAQSFDGSPLNWDERDRVVVSSERFEDGDSA